MTPSHRFTSGTLAFVFALSVGACGPSKNSGATSTPSSNAASPKSVQQYSIDKAEAWMHWSGMSLADVVNEDETRGVKLGGVGFMRAPAGATSSFEFAYDEVLVVTKGRCTVESGRGSFPAAAGQVLYLPAGVSGTFRVDEDVELVYVASSPYGEVNRQAKADLLKESARQPAK